MISVPGAELPQHQPSNAKSIMLLIVATLAMLVLSDDSNIDSERLTSAHGTERIRSAPAAIAWSCPALVGIDIGTFSASAGSGRWQDSSRLPDMAKYALFAFHSCV